MNTLKVNASDLSEAFTNILEEFKDEEAEKIEQITKEISKECRDDIKNYGRQQQGKAKPSYSWKDYLSGWTFTKKKQGKTNVVYHVHNRKKPGLVHLLEFGHAKANQYGEISGRANSFPHVVPAEEMAKKKYMQRLKEEL